jgi:uncharacterized membrane protein YjjB (DUF3815 family)
MIYIGSTEVPANTLGAFVAALASTMLIRRTTIPAFGLVSAALLPLVPGLALYNGLLQVVGTSPETANPSEGGSTLLVALGVALGIAAGATLGTYLGRPIAEQLRHIPTRPVDGDPAWPQNAYDAARGCARLRDRQRRRLQSVSSRRRRG